MAYKIVRENEVKNRQNNTYISKSNNSSNTKSWFKKLGKHMLWGWGFLILFAFIPCYIKMAYIGNEPALSTDSNIKKFLLSGIDQPLPAPSPNIPESTKQELAALKLEVETLKKQQLTSRGGIDREKRIIIPKTNLEILALAEAKHVGLDPILAFTLIQTESGWNIDAVNVNKGGGRVRRTVDYGLVQLNDYGIVTGYIGKSISLSDGRTVKVNNTNWKTDVLVNMSIGFREMKNYYDISKNVYCAYAMYNGGDGCYYNCLKKVPNLSSLGITQTVEYLYDGGYGKCASNVKNNFHPSYMKYNKN